MPPTQLTETRSANPTVSSIVRPRQNWVLNPRQDALLIIGTPLLITGIALASFRFLSPGKSLSWIGFAYVVFTVAHHLPTFLRIYGDVDLFRRFKWSFLLGPLIPFTFASGVLIYLNTHHYPLEYFFYLLLFLAIWDPWHFLMQHYGFMRIYDRANAAPRTLASRMDFWLCASWFGFIMLASGDWLPSLLGDLYAKAHLPVILAFSMTALQGVERTMLGLAVSVTFVYLCYTYWCWRKGYYISFAKFGLFVISFSVMYFTYTPNALILALAPAWTFKVGFATMGIVHDSQYLAIVWRYNRSLAGKAHRAREGWFKWINLKGGVGIAIAYVIVCLTYGEVVTRIYDNRWIASALLAVGFTSTLMHYYFDGFIWKVRHEQNRENLNLNDGTLSSIDPEAKAAPVSWWSSIKALSAKTVLLRQLSYFGVPMALLTMGAWWAWQQPMDYRRHQARAELYSKQGLNSEVLGEAQLALDAMDARLPLVDKMADLQPTAEHKAELAYLRYRRSQYAEFVLPSLRGSTIGPDNSKRHSSQVQQAITTLEEALTQGGSLGQLGSDPITPTFARETLAAWKEVLGKLAAELDARSR